PREQDHVAQEDRGPHAALDDPEQGRGVQLSLDEARQAEWQEEEQPDREDERHDHSPGPHTRPDFLGVLVGLALGQLRVGGDAKRLEANRKRPPERDDPAQYGNAQRAMARERGGEREGGDLDLAKLLQLPLSLLAAELSLPCERHLQRVRNVARTGGGAIGGRSIA